MLNANSRLGLVKRGLAGALIEVALLSGIGGAETAGGPQTVAPTGSTSVAPAEKPLVPRASHASRARSLVAADLERSFENRIELKLREGSGIRSRKGRLAVASGAPGAAAASTAELAALQAVLDGLSRHAVVRMHTLPEERLDAMKEEGEQASGRELADLNLWFYVYVDVPSSEALADLLNQLNALDIVEYAAASDLPAPPPTIDEEGAAAWSAYWREHRSLPWPTAREILAVEAGLTLADETPQRPGVEALRPLKAAGTPPPAPGNYEPSQDYQEAAPVGIDVDYLRASYWNGFGDNWGYTDAEYSWTQTHADLSGIAGASALVNGTPSVGALVWRDHGTAVIGEISSDDNGWGTTGLAPNAAVRLSTECPVAGCNRAGAITAAASQFWKGAVILLEMQRAASFDCNGDAVADGNDLVPTEYDAADKDAIRTATANGRIVVEAAGNGNCNLDLAGFAGEFSPGDASKDSGAIIVGAGEKSTRNKAGFSTYGSRVDTQAEGDGQIYTTGYGDLYGADGEDRFYTATFGGTSGASPIVTGGAVSLAGVLWIYHGSIFDPREIRALFRREGTPQGSGGHIGRRPDLRKHANQVWNRHLQMHSADFDGDGRTDYTVWRPGNGTWYIRYAAGGTVAIQWGQRGDIPAPANVAGDARAELIVFRPSNGNWYIRRWNGTSQVVSWGTNGDIPVPLDYTGDGRAELAVYRTLVGGSTGRWFIRYWGGGSTTITLGERTNTPMARDFDGDGRDDLAVFDGWNGAWKLRYATGSTADYTWGQWGDVPLTYQDSSGQWNIAVWRPSSGRLYWNNIHTAITGSFVYGLPGDIPRFGDANGDSWDELIIYRPSNGRWFNSGLGGWVAWGGVSDIAVAR